MQNIELEILRHDQEVGSGIGTWKCRGLLKRLITLRSTSLSAHTVPIIPTKALFSWQVFCPRPTWVKAIEIKDYSYECYAGTVNNDRKGYFIRVFAAKAWGCLKLELVTWIKLIPADYTQQENTLILSRQLQLTKLLAVFQFRWR